jgi:hypothetical protein
VAPTCALGTRKGSSEAPAGVGAGRAIAPPNAMRSGAPTLLAVRRTTSFAAISRTAGDRSRSDNDGMYGNSIRENREPDFTRPMCGRQEHGIMGSDHRYFVATAMGSGDDPRSASALEGRCREQNVPWK